MSEDIRAKVHEGRMSAFQIAAVTICMVINMLDGFDVLAIAFAGPVIAKDWALAPTELGLLFSAGLAGMTAGSLFLSPFADTWGRRPVVLAGLVVISIGMIGSAFTHGLWELAGLRVFTGLGIGTLLSSINTIVAEYSSRKRMDFAVSFMAIGYPVGATLGGMVSIWLITQFGWRAIFIFGGIVSAVIIPVVMVRLPESLDFLLIKRPKHALARINALLAKMNKGRIDALPEIPPHETVSVRSVTGIFNRSFLEPTLLICISYFMVMLSLYFLLNWTPKVLVDQGMSLQYGISGAVLMNAGGVIGGLLMGYFAGIFGLRRLSALYMVLLFVSVTAFGFAKADLLTMAAIVTVIGFFLIGVIASLYALVAAMYPPQVRNTGTGLAIGIGRFGAIAGPYLGGVLIAAGWPRPAYCVALALPTLLAAILVVRVPLAGRPPVSAAPDAPPP